MAREFAFLFYPGDYLRDTQCLSPAAQVAYDRIMCEHMRSICISIDRIMFFAKRLSDDEKVELFSVLVKTDMGYHIQWVVESVEKRRAYTDSRRKNASKSICSTYAQHMEIEKEKGILKREESAERGEGKPKPDPVALRIARAEAFTADVLSRTTYPQEMLREFLSYWTEPNKSGAKCRWELEATWETERRLATWARRQKMSAARPHNGKSFRQIEEERIAEQHRRIIEEGDRALQRLGNPVLGR